MDNKTFENLERLSKISFEPSEKQKYIEKLDNIIKALDIVKSFPLNFDDTKDNNQVGLYDLRKDKFEISFPAEKLLQNTESMYNCYQIPKIME